MNGSNRQRPVDQFEKSLNESRIQIQERREGVQKKSGRSISENRSKWLRTTIKTQSGGQLAH